MSRLNNKKRLFIFCYLIFIIIFNTNSFAASEGNTQQTGEKFRFFITDFKTDKSIIETDYLKSALPKSIRTTLQNHHFCDYSSTNQKNSLLIKTGFMFAIRGKYTIKGKDIVVDFSVEYLAKNSFIILADITGFADNRIFDLIDRAVQQINRVAQGDIDKTVKNPLIISIDRQGKVTLKNLSGIDLSYREFTDLKLSHLNIIGTNFSHSSLTNSIFSDSIMHKSKFVNSILTGSDFSKVLADAIDFTGTNLTGVNFWKAKIVNPILDNALIDTYGDFIVGIHTLSGNLGAVSFQGRILNRFYLGIRTAYGYKKDGNNVGNHVLPLFFTFSFYFIDYDALHLNILRPYIQLGGGYSFTLSGNKKQSYAGFYFAGLDWHLREEFALNVELGVLLDKGIYNLSAGLGVKFYPNIYIKKIKPRTESGSYTFLGLKAGIGINFALETADEQIPDDGKYKMRIPFSAGVRFIYFPHKSAAGLILDFEYNRLGGSKDNTIEKSILNLDYLIINAIAAFPFAKSFFVGVGLSTGIRLNANKSYTFPSGTYSDLNCFTRPFVFGFIITLGYSFSAGELKMITGIDIKMDIINVFKTGLSIDYPEGYAYRNITILLYFGIGI